MWMWNDKVKKVIEAIIINLFIRISTGYAETFELKFRGISFPYFSTKTKTSLLT